MMVMIVMLVIIIATVVLYLHYTFHLNTLRIVFSAFLLCFKKRSYHVTQTGLEFTNLFPALASCVLGLQACASKAQLPFYFPSVMVEP